MGVMGWAASPTSVSRPAPYATPGDNHLSPMRDRVIVSPGVAAMAAATPGRAQPATRRRASARHASDDLGGPPKVDCVELARAFGGGGGGGSVTVGAGVAGSRTATSLQPPSHPRVVPRRPPSHPTHFPTRTSASFWVVNQ